MSFNVALLIKAMKVSLDIGTLSVSPRCIFSSSCVGELRNVGSIVSIASNSSPFFELLFFNFDSFKPRSTGMLEIPLVVLAPLAPSPGTTSKLVDASPFDERLQS